MREHYRPGFSALLLGVLVTVLIMGSSGQAWASEFAYSGDIGPGFWSELSEAWAACGMDGRQSPVNLQHVRFDPDLKPLDLHLEATSINLRNNGHTIEQAYEEGSTVNFEGREYRLLQFHFHTISEHAVRGQHGVMELHAVFRHEVSGALLVIGQLYRLGEENEFLATFDDILPRRKDDRESAGDKINLADGLLNTQSYYTYPGSLTTPPCSPIVTWIVLKKRATLSEAQLQAFRSILGNNFRPLQDLNEREIRATLGGSAISHR